VLKCLRADDIVEVIVLSFETHDGLGGRCVELGDLVEDV
jgi:hypothetical protein